MQFGRCVLRYCFTKRKGDGRLASRHCHTHQRRRHATNVSQLAFHPPKSIARKAQTHNSNATSPTRHATMESSSPSSSHPQRNKQDERPPRASVLSTSPRCLAFSASKSSTLCQNIPAASRRTCRSAHVRNRHDAEPPHVPYTRVSLDFPRAGRRDSDSANVVHKRSTYIDTSAADTDPLAECLQPAPHALTMPAQGFLAAAA